MRPVANGPDAKHDCERGEEPVNLKRPEESKQLVPKRLAELAVVTREDTPMQKRIFIKQRGHGA
jgi:hypothetical protein